MSDIPKWAFARVSELTGKNKSSMQVFEDFARYIAEHEQPPVDPLDARAIALVRKHYPEAKEAYRGRRFLIAREALELAERPPLTRGMVRNAVVISRPFTDDLGNDGRFIDRLHAALVERMTQGEG
jgi:hypothetical protein